MKKALVAFVVIFLLQGICYAQIKSKNKATATKPESEIVKEKAEKWFREVYAERFFKDPYSYRLMGLKAIPVTLREQTNQQLAEIQIEIDTCTVAEVDRNQETYDECVRRYNDYKQKMDIEQEAIDKGIIPKYHTQRKAIFAKAANQYKELSRRIALYLLGVEYKDKMLKILSRYTDEDFNSIVHYDIRLDCYSKNSLGNEVLGRYSFPFTIDGPKGEEDGIDTVVQLNK